MAATEGASPDSNSKKRRIGEEERGAGSEAMEASIQQIQHKIEQFTQLVSGMLEAGKTFFSEVANAFEENVVQLHQKQVEKWEEEIQMLRAMDAMNEDMNFRLNNAQSLMGQRPAYFDLTH